MSGAPIQPGGMRNAAARARVEELMRTAASLRTSGEGSLADGEKLLLQVACELGAIVTTRDTVSGFPLEATQKILMEWGINPLFDLVDGGMKLQANQQVFSSKLYSSLYQIAKAAIDGGLNNPSLLQAWILECVRKYMTERVLPALASKSGAAVFSELQRRWNDHKTITEWVRRLVKSLDDQYVSLTHKSASGAYRKDPTITSASLNIFKEAAFESRKGFIGASILDLIRSEREGGVIDRAQVRSVLELLVVMTVCMRKPDFSSIQEVENVTRNAKPSAAGLALSDTDLYVLDFERPFLEASREYFTASSQRWISLTAPDFARAVEDCLTQEEDRVLSMMHVATLPKLLAVLSEVVITPNLDAMLNKDGSGVLALLRRGTDGTKDLGIIYKVAARTSDGPRKFAAVLKQYMVEQGKRFLAERESRFRASVSKTAGDAEGADATAAGAPGKEEGATKKKVKPPSADDPDFIIPLVDLHSMHAMLVREHLSKDKDCNRAVREAMELLLNSQLPIEDDDAFADISFPSIIDTYVEYLNSILSGKAKIGGVKMTPEDIDRAWRAALDLFPFLNDKDVFRDSYRFALAKRLLNDRSESLENERAVVAEMKAHAGTQFHQTETMILNLQQQQEREGDNTIFKNVELSRERHNKTFPDAIIPKVTMSVKILDKAAWPTFINFDKPVLPKEITFHMDEYLTAYKKSESINERKRLDWQFALGSSSVVFHTTAAKDVELSCSTVQMLLLLTMNDAPSFKVSELAGKVGLPLDKVKLALAPMTADRTVKQQVLQVVGATKMKPAGENDVIQPNSDFHKNQKAKHSVPKVDLEGSADKAKSVEDRKYVIDAVLVRIMKSRKQMKFEELIGEAVRQLTFFKAEIRDMRRAIENLIGREYFERDEDTPDLLRYLA